MVVGFFLLISNYSKVLIATRNYEKYFNGNKISYNQKFEMFFEDNKVSSVKVIYKCSEPEFLNQLKYDIFFWFGNLDSSDTKYTLELLGIEIKQNKKKLIIEFPHSLYSFIYNSNISEMSKLDLKRKLKDEEYKIIF